MMAAKYIKIGAIVAAFASGWMANGLRYNAKISDMQAEAAQQRELAVMTVRAIEKQQRDKIEKEVQNARDKIKDIDSQRDSLAATIERLRQSPASCDAGQAASADRGQGQRGENPTDLPADLSARIATRAAEIAEYADRLKAAGVACEAVY